MPLDTVCGGRVGAPAGALERIYRLAGWRAAANFRWSSCV